MLRKRLGDRGLAEVGDDARVAGERKRQRKKTDEEDASAIETPALAKARRSVLRTKAASLSPAPSNTQRSAASAPIPVAH